MFIVSIILQELLFISNPLGLLGTVYGLSDLARGFEAEGVSSLYGIELQDLSFSGKDQIPANVVEVKNTDKLVTKESNVEGDQI